jgi:hypothetical protein
MKTVLRKLIEILFRQGISSVLIFRIGPNPADHSTTDCNQSINQQITYTINVRSTEFFSVLTVQSQLNKVWEKKNFRKFV